MLRAAGVYADTGVPGAYTFDSCSPRLTVICLPVVPPAVTVTVSEVFMRFVSTVPTGSELSARSGIVRVCVFHEFDEIVMASAPVESTRRENP